MCAFHKEYQSPLLTTQELHVARCVGNSPSVKIYLLFLPPTHSSHVSRYLAGLFAEPISLESTFPTRGCWAEYGRGLDVLNSNNNPCQQRNGCPCSCVPPVLHHHLQITLKCKACGVNFPCSTSRHITESYIPEITQGLTEGLAIVIFMKSFFRRI